MSSSTPSARSACVGAAGQEPGPEGGDGGRRRGRQQLLGEGGELGQAGKVGGGRRVVRRAAPAPPRRSSAKARSGVDGSAARSARLDGGPVEERLVAPEPGRDAGGGEGALDRCGAARGCAPAPRTTTSAGRAGGSPTAAAMPVASSASVAKACTFGRWPVGPDRPGPAGGIGTRQRARRGHHLGRRAVGGGETHHRGPADELGEAGQQRGVGSVPAVDGLVRVADDAQVGPASPPGLEEGELQRVDVLELVDEQVPEPPALRGGERRSSCCSSRAHCSRRSSKSTSRRRRLVSS